MAAPVQLVFSEQSAALPADYTFPPGLDVELASVRARINGAAASGAFIVALEALSQDGKIMAQARIDQELAVGDTGALTWAPFLRRVVAAANGGATADYAYLARTTNLLIASGGFAILDAYTSSGSTGTTFTLDAAGGTIKPTVAGRYLAMADVTWTTTFAGGQFAQLNWDVQQIVGGRFSHDFWNDHSSSINHAVAWSIVTIPGGGAFTGLSLTVGQTSGVNRTMDNAELRIVGPL